MTEAQEHALWELQIISEGRPSNFDVSIVHLPSDKDSQLRVEVGLRVDTLPAATGGIQLRAREEFVLVVSREFPFEQPSVWVNHTRFAGRPHVQWARHLCLYQSASEWNASDGMFGLIQRLCDWLTKAAANQLDPDGQPLHPPAVYADHAQGKLVVPLLDTPAFSGPYWIGVGELREFPNRLEIVAWHPLNMILAEGRFALTLLFRREWSWEYPTHGDSLFAEFEKQGVDTNSLLQLLTLGASDGLQEVPMYIAVGTPMRGVAGGVRRQHIAVWSLDPTIKASLALALPKTGDSADIAELRVKLTHLVDKCLRQARLTWCPIMEGRAEVTVRRDATSSLARFQGCAVALWGCGALGAPIALALCRAGASRLVLVDNGRVSPGLLVRQPFYADDVGKPKVEALKDHLLAIRPEILIETSFANVTGQIAAGANWAADCDLVIDATASEMVRKRIEKEWNRTLSNRVSIASLMIDASASRLIVAFSHPEASGATWDTLRKAKLALLRASQSEFADAFFPTAAPTRVFQPEPGCSEPTFEGSATDTGGLAAIGMNLIADWWGITDNGRQRAAVFAAPRMGNTGQRPRFFEFVPDTVSHIDHYEVRIAPPVYRELHGWIEQNRRLRAQTVETGGLLWGEWDDATGTIWISDASGPPPDSEHSADFFLCGQKGTATESTARLMHTRNGVQYVGMWHTHPQSRPLPSVIDIAGMAEILSRGPTPPRKNILCIVGRDSAKDALGVFVFVRRTSQDDFQTLRCTGSKIVLPEYIL